MKLSTKRTKHEQALDHSQHHAQAKNMAANLREQHTVDHRIRPDDRFCFHRRQTAGDVRKGSSILQDTI